MRSFVFDIRFIGLDLRDDSNRLLFFGWSIFLKNKNMHVVQTLRLCDFRPLILSILYPSFLLYFTNDILKIILLDCFGKQSTLQQQSSEKSTTNSILKYLRKYYGIKDRLFCLDSTLVNLLQNTTVQRRLTYRELRYTENMVPILWNTSATTSLLY